MSMRRIIFLLAVCLLAVVPAGKTLSQTSRPGNKRFSRATPEQRSREFERQAARRQKLYERQWAKRKKEYEQRIKDSHEGKNTSRNKKIKKVLEVTEEQWKVIEPLIDKIYFLRNQSKLGVRFSLALAGPEASDKPVIEEKISESGNGGYVMRTYSGSGSSVGYGGSGGGTGSSGGGGGARTLSLNGPPWRLLDRELTEVEKVCDELYELLKDENPEKEEIVQKTEALLRAREEAGRQLIETQKELRGLLDYRQEANLILTKVLD